MRRRRLSEVLEQRARELRLPDDRRERAETHLTVIWYRNCDVRRRRARQHAMAAPTPNFDERVIGEEPDDLGA